MDRSRTCVFVCAAAVALVASGAAAAGNGPRGSVAAATVCGLNLDIFMATFDVEIRVSDKSSGLGVPTGVETVVDLLGKDSPGPWKVPPQKLLASETVAPFNVPTMITASFDLCEQDLTDIVGLNALVALTYDDGTGKQRTINNRCSDDLDTTDVEEPAGIKLDQATKDAIDAICNP